MYIHKYQFEWHIAKDLGNWQKHGVSFAEACSVFLDIEGLVITDLPHSVSEIRYRLIGRSERGSILVVIYTVREGIYGQEKIRIISARRANRKEKSAYSR